MSRRRTIGVIGAGRLGASLAAALLRAGYDVRAVASARPESAAALVRALGDAEIEVAEPQAVAARCELVFLTIPDGSIESTAAALDWRPGQAVVYCSGALGLEVLTRAVAAGALTGCLHPLQSFPSREPAPALFEGIVCGVEGAEPLDGELEAIVGDLGARVVRLEGVDRARYHAAAVFASNYVVALASAAGRAWSLAGLPPDSARLALAPLLGAAAANVGVLELAEALTGPVARGDVETVARHEAALAVDASLLALYRALGAELLRLPLPHSPVVRERLRELITDESEGEHP